MAHNSLLISQTSQITIDRIEKMPSVPAPYNLRDWKKVARQYDSFVYDINKTGQYLPLVTIGAKGVNYPQNKTIQMASYVGSSAGSEAINILPSLVGASLVGIDKSNQFGQNWLLMAQDFFNKANGENLYLNNSATNSGNDWWYDVMPNVFFYQLLDLNPNMGGEANSQFTIIADRFLESLRAMGGGDTPWNVPNMNYRAWKFKTMQGNSNGVKEPEAAGAIAWILYNAYKKTNNRDYLKGAEWAMEFLDNLQTNPSYELQLPYGIYTAAKMNAEIGTHYDVQKMVNWSFNRGEIRGWGTIVGNWGGFDVSGLVGEANDGGNDYAFQLNGVQQAAALAPMVRYDKRFARATAKWILNLANATRLFYPGFLPNALQDGAYWSNANDPNHVIGYEALREKLNGLSPVSTGDALKGGWAATNLSLYSSSSIGYLGALIDTTNVEKILKIDLLKTDFYRSDSSRIVSAYPTYLFFNPNTSTANVNFDAGTSNANLYEALSETFIAKNVSGKINLLIKPNEAILVSITPANGKISYDKNKMLIDNIVVDYQQSNTRYLKTVRIKSLASSRKIIAINDTTRIFGTVDSTVGNIIYTWRASSGTILGDGKSVIFKASPGVGTSKIQLIASNLNGKSDTANLEISVVAKINQAPVISDIQKSAPYVSTNGTILLLCNARDINNDSITYAWTVSGGNLNLTNARSVTFKAPNAEGIYTVTVTASNNSGLFATASTTLLVKNFDSPIGRLIAYYPFSGNADDVSGNALHGAASGIVYVPDRNGTPLKACYFNGGTQNVKVKNNDLLNFQDATTASCWFNAAQLPDKETFLLSHGSWQNRWKISLTPDKKIRWTINTLTTIADLDAPQLISTDSFYHITATYDGALMALYVNGNLVAYKTVSGKIRTTAIDFMMGQILPDDTNYNFKGVLDEVKLYNYALIPVVVKEQFQQSFTDLNEAKNISNYILKISPNPSTDFIKIEAPLFENSETVLTLVDIFGKVLFEKTFSDFDPEKKIEIRALPNGLYFLTERSKNFFGSAKFLKVK